MTSKKIYLIRHGQTEFNKLGIVQGSGVNSSLNETGRAQAQAFYDYYKQIPFDKIYTSALIRTSESVAGFINSGIPVEHRKELNEISWGEMDGKLASGSEKNQYWDLLDRWKAGQVDFSMWGGESPVQVQNRLRVVVKEWEKGNAENLLVCMHGRAIRILLSTLMDTPLVKMDQYEHSNLCLYKLSFREGIYQIEEANNVEHLAPLGKM